MGTPTLKFITRATESPGSVIIGKSYDYTARKVKYKSGKEYYHLYRRTFEGEPWELYGKCLVGQEALKKAWRFYEVTEGRVYGKKEED